jgi:TusA-related sulfurtransferase
MVSVIPDKSVDCVGLYCPEPIFKTRQALDGIKSGEVLEVIADDPGSEEDIPRLVKRLGHELLELSKEGSEIRFLIKKA